MFSGLNSIVTRVELLTPSQFAELMLLLLLFLLMLRLRSRQLAVDWQLYSVLPPSSASPDKLNFRLDLQRLKINYHGQRNQKEKIRKYESSESTQHITLKFVMRKNAP